MHKDLKLENIMLASVQPPEADLLEKTLLAQRFDSSETCRPRTLSQNLKMRAFDPLQPFCSKRGWRR